MIPIKFRRSLCTKHNGIHLAFIALGALTVVSTLIFVGLRRDDGSSVSQHKAELPAETV